MSNHSLEDRTSAAQPHSRKQTLHCANTNAFLSNDTRQQLYPERLAALFEVFWDDSRHQVSGLAILHSYLVVSCQTLIQRNSIIQIYLWRCAQRRCGLQFLLWPPAAFRVPLVRHFLLSNIAFNGGLNCSPVEVKFGFLQALWSSRAYLHLGLIQLRNSTFQSAQCSKTSPWLMWLRISDIHIPTNFKTAEGDSISIQ
jgi:hypothetical protein